MMSELRWALLILGVVFLVALVLWERRRPRQASGALERSSRRESAAESPVRLVRDPPLTLPEVRVREPTAAAELPVVEVTRGEPAVPFKPAADAPAHELDAAQARATLRADANPADADHTDADHPDAGFPRDAPDAEGPDAEVADAEGPDTEVAEAEVANAEVPDVVVPDVELPDAEEVTGELPRISVAPLAAPRVATSASEETARTDVRTDGGAPREALPELPPLAPMVVDWPAEHQRRILALRLVAPQRERFAGRSLRQALAAEGFLLGQFEIFHKPDDDRRAVLSAASLTRPGTFDMETMDSQHYGGLSLFAVLPGPKPARQAFDELVFAARNLNERLHGVLQDEQGAPLTPARIAQLRDQLRAGAAS